MRTKPTKYNKKVVDKICALISKDTYTIAEICATVRISERTYYEWQANIAEFAESIARARQQFDETIVNEAKNSLRKKVNGYEVDEKKTVYVNDADGRPKIKEQTTIKKHFQPDTEAIKFVLTNKASDEYQNRQNTELTGKDGKDLFAKVSDDELDKRIADLERKIKG
jgi:hypothetical protein